MIAIFTGSVFLTSGKFVNATNTPKFYFVVVLLLIMGIALAVRIKRINLTYLFDHKIFLWVVYLVCIVQACYGLCQYIDWLPSNHSKFAITGSFDNPAGFAAILGTGFPTGLLLFIRAKETGRYLILTGLTVIVLSVFLSGSRAGTVAITISFLIFLILQTNITSRFRQIRFYKLKLASILVFLLVSAFILYFQKRDSANGRLLIWKVSTEMVKDKPFWGHGYGAFKAEYMDYQAKYFKENPDSKFGFLADNVKHPFNELIKILVEFGLIGLSLLFAFIFFVLRVIKKSKSEFQALTLSGLAAFLIFAGFSYPSRYIAVWLLLAFYLLLLLPVKEFRIENNPLTLIGRVLTIVACSLGLLYIEMQMKSEIKWKTIAQNSLKGETIAMLPEYKKLYPLLKTNPFFLYNYGAELDVAGKFDESLDVLAECQEDFNDYDLQMLLADNYYKKGELTKAIETYKYASNMIPCRFLPLYQLFEIYKETGQADMASQYADKIINKKVKIPSGTVSYIQREANAFLTDRYEE
jgi:O-antigen ligase